MRKHIELLNHFTINLKFIKCMNSKHQTEKKRSNPLEDDTSLRLITTWL